MIFEPSDFAIIGFMFCGVGGPKNNKMTSATLDDLCQVVALEGRHVTRAATRTIVVAHAGPFIGPFIAAASA